jgi:hypothetical protein
MTVIILNHHSDNWCSADDSHRYAYFDVRLLLPLVSSVIKRLNKVIMWHECYVGFLSVELKSHFLFLSDS